MSKVDKASGKVANGWDGLLSWDGKTEEGASNGWGRLIRCDTSTRGEVLDLGGKTTEGPISGMLDTDWDGMDSEDSGGEGGPP